MINYIPLVELTPDTLQRTICLNIRNMIRNNFIYSWHFLFPYKYYLSLPLNSLLILAHIIF